MTDDADIEPPTEEQKSDAAKFYLIIGGTVFLGAAAFGASLLLDTPLPAQFHWNWGDVAWGLIATAPLAAFLHWFVNTGNAMFAEFRRSQIEFFAEIGFEFTMLRITLMAIGAGVCEELLFRGVLQTYGDRHAPLVVAIVGTNILFGVLHWRTALFAIIAGAVGAYLGVLFWLAGNLLTPVITHGVYDFIALWYTRIAINDYRASGRI